MVLVWQGPRNTQERVMFGRRQLPLLRELVRIGVTPSVALAGDAGGFSADLAASGIDATVLPTLPPPGSALPSLAPAAMQLRRFLKKRAPHLVEASDPMPGVAAALATRGIRRTVFVYRRHFYGGRLRMRVPSHLAAFFADRMITSCETLRRYFAIDERKPLARVDVSTSGIAEPPELSADDIAAARAELGIAPSARVIGAVAFLRRQKGIDVLIHALDHCRDAGDVHLLIAGAGPEENTLRPLARNAPLPVHFLGHRDDVHRWIAASDVIAIPSREECFGRVTLEAMAAGRPIVAARAGGLNDAVSDGVTGLLVPIDDAPALGSALRSLLIDSKRARALGTAARERYESQYTIAHMAASWRDAWQRALAVPQ